MKTELKLLLIVASMLLSLTTATIINVSLNFRDYSIKSAVEKAKLTATLFLSLFFLYFNIVIKNIF